METYCVSCKKYTANKNSSVRKTKQNKLMLLSNCSVCGKNYKLLLKIKNFTILIILRMISLKWIKSLRNLLTRDKFMPALYLKQSGLTYSAYGPFTKFTKQVI